MADDGLDYERHLDVQLRADGRPAWHEGEGQDHGQWRATGYLLTDATREELLEAIRLGGSRSLGLAISVASRLVARMAAPIRSTLSAREIEVLELVARRRCNREIARVLHLSEATVKTHLVHSFSKLGVDDRTEAVTAALDRGIIRLS
jgi:DNA-binding NarL/FixJ family response regulator